MTLKYESELLFDLMKRDGDDTPSDVLPYESELKEKYLNQVVGAYPKLQDYQPEWLNYNLYHHIPSDFPIESVTNVTSASFNHVVPYAYKSAILKGCTGYRDIDTGEILETFEEGRNLELVSVKLPVLTTTGKNTFNIKNAGATRAGWYSIPLESSFSGEIYVKVAESLPSDFRVNIFANREYPLLNSQIKNGYTGKFQNVTAIDFHCPSLLIVESLRGNLDDLIANKKIVIKLDGEPYKSNILSTSEDVVLRGIGDVKDTLDCLTGEVVERIGEVVLDGNSDENWVSKRNITVNNIEYKQYYLVSHPISSKNGSSSAESLPNIICDKGTTDTFNGLWLGGSVKTISVREDGGLYHFCMNFPKNEDIKEWLSQNPITICYQLETESIKTVELTVTDQDGKTASTIRPNEGTMHVSTSSQALTPLLDMSVPVEATTQNLASFANIEEEE